MSAVGARATSGRSVAHDRFVHTGPDERATRDIHGGQRCAHPPRRHYRLTATALHLRIGAKPGAETIRSPNGVTFTSRPAQTGRDFLSRDTGSGLSSPPTVPMAPSIVDMRKIIDHPQ